jgi:ferric-dicitrate binding protein FerR (iron transport regulator)
MTWVEIKAPAWTRAQFSLPDGTTGWLNSNSSIRYYENFDRERDVILNGEVYLDVSKDENNPFKVRAGDIIVTVTGTKLNIASYEDEDIVEVVLEEGEVICSNIDNQDLYTLKSNDYLTFNKNTKDFNIGVVENEKYSSWKEGKLVFRNDPLDVIARRLERWYNIDVELKGDFSDKPTLRATFLDENLEDVLRLLRLSLSVNYEIESPGIQADGIYSKIKVIITTHKH